MTKMPKDLNKLSENAQSIVLKVIELIDNDYDYDSNYTIDLYYWFSRHLIFDTTATDTEIIEALNYINENNLYNGYRYIRVNNVKSNLDERERHCIYVLLNNSIQIESDLSSDKPIFIGDSGVTTDDNKKSPTISVLYKGEIIPHTEYMKIQSEMEEPIYEVLKFIELLRDIPRIPWYEKYYSNNGIKYKSVAERVYESCMIAIIINNYFKLNYNISKILEGIFIEELGEILLEDGKLENEEKIADLKPEVLNNFWNGSELQKKYSEYKGGAGESDFISFCRRLEALIEVKSYQSEKENKGEPNWGDLHGNSELRSMAEGKTPEEILFYICKKNSSLTFKKILDTVERCPDHSTLESKRENNSKRRK